LRENSNPWNVVASAPRFLKECTDLVQVETIDVPEKSKVIAVHVKHTQQLLVSIEHRHHDLRPGGAGTSDMTCETSHVLHTQRLFSLSRCATNPFTKEDAQTAMATLIRADHQRVRRRHPIKSGPIKPFKPVMKLTDNRRHCGHEIFLSLKE